MKKIGVLSYVFVIGITLFLTRNDDLGLRMFLCIALTVLYAFGYGAINGYMAANEEDVEDEDEEETEEIEVKDTDDEVNEVNEIGTILDDVSSKNNES